MSVLTVGQGEEYQTIEAAVAATKDGDTVQVQAGLYVNDFVTISHQITLESVGGMAILQATAQPPNGKAIMTVDNSATIDGFGFTGATVGDNNGAGIRYEGGDLVVNNSLFWDNQDGLLSAPSATGTILIENSEFSHNGAGDGATHNIYVGDIAALTIENSYFHDAVVGHEIKSRAQSNTIINNRIFDNNTDDSYSIDLPDGGVGLIQGNVIEKGANAENYTTIHFGGEGPPYAGSNLTITDNTIVNDNANGFLVNDAADGDPVTLTGNSLYGFAPRNIASGNVTQSDNTVLTDRPTLDLTSAAPPIPLVAPPPPVVVVPSTTVLVSWGRDGAVVATGHVLTVGATGEFRTLSSALAASVDGDTIEVAAGTYVNDFSTVNHKVIIEGVGGIAHFVQDNVPWGPSGLLTINADATIKNIEVSGASTSGGHEGGITVLGGNVTLDNVELDHNDIGLRGIANPDESISVFDSDIGFNGNTGKDTNNADIGAIGSFTIENSYIHDANAAHELVVMAYNSDIENNRVIDGPTSPSSYQIDLGGGGNALVQGNVIEKGINSVNDILVHVGGDTTTYDNSNVRVIGNTLVSDMVNTGHPYTYFVWSPLPGSILPLLVSDNLFQGGVPGSQQTAGGTAGSGNATTTGTVLDTSSPISTAGIPQMFGAAVGADTLTLTLSETRYGIDAQFLVLVDGVIAGGGLVSADTDSGDTDTFSFLGNWSAGPHEVTIQGVNLGGEGGAAGSALNIHNIAIDGTSVNASETLALRNPSFNTQLDIPPPAGTAAASTDNTLVLHLSEDAYAGDAQFTVSVDGQQVGGLDSVTALHALGQSQLFTFGGAFDSGAHTVSITLVNYAYGDATHSRNLYVDSVAVNGTVAPAATAVLNDHETLSFVVPSADPAATVFGSGSDSIVVDLSEDAFHGDAQFTVSIDGKQIGGVLAATSVHAAGQTEAFTFKGDYGAGPHQVAVAFLNDAYGGVGLDRNLYVDAVTMDGQSVAGAQVAMDYNQSRTFITPVVTTAVAPLTPAPTPDPTPAPTPDPTPAPTPDPTAGTTASPPDPTPTSATPSLVVNLSEDAYLGDAQFTISIDGVQIGSPQDVTAQHGLGQTQAFTYDGVLTAGPHAVRVTFINDAYGGSSATDRNLYLDSVTLGGVRASNDSAPLWGNNWSANVTVTAPASTNASTSASTQTLALTPAPASGGTSGQTTQPGPDSLIVHLSEDMFQGDAQFVVSLDGKQLGAAQSVTALQSLGQTQDFAFTGDFGPGHHDLAVSFLNDAYGGQNLDRNLYVHGASLDGVQYASQTTPLWSNGTVHFTIGATS